MHHIYARSTLCLVAFAGLDANYGLRGLKGISAPRAIDQVVLPIANGEAIAWYNDPRATWDSFGQTPVNIGLTYNERGWTYQEFVFAKRRLIFTNGPLRWICPCTIWGEDKVIDLVVDNMANMPFTKWKDRQRPGLASLLTDVASEFNVRYFTFHQDILNAFLGIQNHLHRTFLGGLNHGHPDMFFDISLMWEPEAEISRRGSSRDAPTEPRYLPTWSWMGWHGAFRFLCDDEYECYGPPSNGVVEPVTQWFALQSAVWMDSVRPIASNWHQYKVSAREDASIVPRGWIRHAGLNEEGKFEIGDARFKYPVPVPSLAMPTDPIEQSRLIFAKTTRAYFTARKFDISSQLRDVELCVELYTATGEIAGFMRLHKQWDEDKIITGHKVELAAVVKGWTTELCTLTPHRLEDDVKHPCYFALCIQWEDGIAKRLGTCKVFADVWERNQEPVDLILG
ncbi:hypothetical protein SLS60_006325 [Paraconiothyrium brasiliense]|uniref:Heterokaryon incompatibility domain-containing protein n=1 Tax=Paraconiothyrium brasiliense TaxID=300254 RepID=A0ABR3RAP4_9PLEO